ncbi:vitamin B12-dependent ribonucleotide reductase [Elysia marginata]|uniref:Vitamin B12-dependent ribonucleotide reductase n=1 Tax=Elysia marginata TaxID=1093978 RepID=A0AAV4ED00_9GAST|nr:vitamin B12-dependent ribonucleotide reductase [Elysia marginata]
MFGLFKQQIPYSTISYESYRSILNTKFNISFSYPRADTCSKCNEIAAKIGHLEQLIPRTTKSPRKAEKALSGQRAPTSKGRSLLRTQKGSQGKSKGRSRNPSCSL